MPKNIGDAEQHEQATACFDWSESFYSRHFGLNAPYFITDLSNAGINTQLFTTKEEKILEEILNKKSIDTTEIEAFAKENYIELIESCVDNFINNIDDDGFDGPKNWKQHGRLAWKPLITIEGPSGWGIEDYYSVYYGQNERSYFEYKAIDRRSCC